MSEYSEKFKDPRWQKKRLKIMERDEFRCVNCEEDKLPLNVHHCFYIRGHDPWDYPDSSLITLCEGCHFEEKEEMKINIEYLIGQLKEMGFTSSKLREIADVLTGVKEDEIKELRYLLPFFIGTTKESNEILSKYSKNWNILT